jgi:hypothetical protein
LYHKTGRKKIVLAEINRFEEGGMAKLSEAYRRKQECHRKPAESRTKGQVWFCPLYFFGEILMLKLLQAEPDSEKSEREERFPGFFVNTEAAWYAALLPFTAGFRFRFEKSILSYEKELGIFLTQKKG